MLGLGMRREHRASLRSGRAASSGGGNPQVEVLHASLDVLPAVAAVRGFGLARVLGCRCAERAVVRSQSLVQPGERLGQGESRGTQGGAGGAKAYFKEMKEANREALKEARAEWKEWRDDWQAQYKLAKEAWKREHPGEKGGPEIQLLRCEPQEYSGDAAIIGPKGGTLHMGDHELVIPEGALDEEVLVSAEAPTSSLVDVKFAAARSPVPETRATHAILQRCVRPTSADLLIAYLGQGTRCGSCRRRWTTSEEEVRRTSTTSRGTRWRGSTRGLWSPTQVVGLRRPR